MLDQKFAHSIAIGMLGIMLIVMFFSALRESAIMDELAHIPAAYSYLTKQDYRLNPEHPPLIKDIAAFPLLFLNLNFPLDVPAWTTDINGQWTMGSIFLYEAGNNPDQILFWSRLPIMLLSLLFGWLFYRWIQKRYGEKIGLLSLFFFITSPTMIAHSRYVTTDLGAAFGFFIGITSFLAFLAKPNKKTLFITGIAFGITQVLKFSLILLIPFYILIGTLWVILLHLDHFRSFESKLKKITHFFREEFKFLGNCILIGIIGFLVIYAVYAFHVWNYPKDIQLRDTAFNLHDVRFQPLAKGILAISDISYLRPAAQYLHGLLMVINRGTHGNTTYFLGETGNAGSPWYFPIAYFLKEQLAFLILAVIALILFIRSMIQAHEKSTSSILEWMRDNFTLTASILFIGIYWINSILSPLNIGVRHVMPTFPFIYLLVSRELIRWAHRYTFTDPQTLKEWIFSLIEIFIKRIPRYLFLIVMLLWMLGSMFLAFPNYLPYYNAIAGGTENGYRFIVDSNYDWGQDLRRLSDFVKENNIQNIKLNYFGGGSPRYYVGDAYEEWWSAKGEPNEGWFAVSATLRQGSWGNPTRGFEIKPEDRYEWLRDETPVARAGYSIFIYNLDKN